MDAPAISPAVAPISRPIDPVRLERAAKAFGAITIAELLEPLFSSVETPAIAGGGKSERFFHGLLQQHYAEAIAARGGFGIADSVKAALIGLQGE